MYWWLSRKTIISSISCSSRNWKISQSSEEHTHTVRSFDSSGSLILFFFVLSMFQSEVGCISETVSSVQGRCWDINMWWRRIQFWWMIFVKCMKDRYEKNCRNPSHLIRADSFDFFIANESIDTYRIFYIPTKITNSQHKNSYSPLYFGALSNSASVIAKCQENWNVT